jgi:hypothetical protein
MQPPPGSAAMTITLTGSFDTGFLPFTFGQPLVLPTMSASLSMFCREICGPSTASVSISSLDIRSSDMQPLPPGITVEFSPDPTSFMISGCGLLGLGIIVGYIRRHENRT